MLYSYLVACMHTIITSMNIYLHIHIKEQMRLFNHVDSQSITQSEHMHEFWMNESANAKQIQ